MKPAPKWQYDERKPCGVDFTDIEEVVAYDTMHQKFRDYARSSEEIMRRLGLGSGSIVIDIGSGTGAFALHAAKKCRTIYAVDISATMLEYCRQNAERQGLSNIVFCHGGLLTYEHVGELADAIVCVAVLHHLPDLWKQVALKRFLTMLKPGGRLLLFDIVFPSWEENSGAKIEYWIQAFGVMATARMAQEALTHVRDEFSTYDWIMEGIIRRSGFRIDAAEYGDGFQTTYVCTRE
ncbi:class I SAM-dependent methyltransferase [Methanothrix sp.]|jgi:ubiquinone/menaquinone biosynthesis C-methylase UbiE|uniref:class I SAM-dependent methyltransferase n=1 Tax=Methanothrix sp. TaxID=90426 RepID=UPI00180FE4A1|nr:methyltransferase domain-containing protein [Methanocellales archaeon]